jgi:tyrosyl-tRNA synthetase
MGTELIRKKLGKEAWGLTIPLLTTSDGKKMGKTEKGAVWLNRAVDGFVSSCSDFDFWQFWRNVDDSDVARFCRMFLNVEVVADTAAEFNQAKKLLATSLTDKVRGCGVGAQMQQQAYELFEAKSIDNTPTIVVSADVLGQNVVRVLKGLGIVPSIGEATRLVDNGGIKINDIKIDNAQVCLSRTDFVNNKLKVSIGKKKHFVLEIE